MEEDCKHQCQVIVEVNEKYDKDREQLQQMVEELTAVVQENKMTLLHLSEINKKQKALILSQSEILLEKVFLSRNPS